MGTLPCLVLFRLEVFDISRTTRRLPNRWAPLGRKATRLISFGFALPFLFFFFFGKGRWGGPSSKGRSGGASAVVGRRWRSSWTKDWRSDTERNNAFKMADVEEEDEEEDAEASRRNERDAVLVKQNRRAISCRVGHAGEGRKGPAEGGEGLAPTRAIKSVSCTWVNV